MTSCIKAGAIVPGLPHLLSKDLNKSYAELSTALENLGNEFQKQGIKRILYFSTQWISVLGHSFQVRPNVKGVHVDENWHDLKDLEFNFNVDAKFGASLAKSVETAGYQTKLIDYDHFPIDTGTIVADSILNRGKFTTSMVSCCVYSDYADTVKFFKSMESTFANDKTPTAVVCVSHLSGRFFTKPIDLREDHISDQRDDQWNKKIISWLESGELGEVKRNLAEYNSLCKTDMGMKVLAVLEGSNLLKEGKKAQKKAYGSLYGTGAAVMSF